MEIVFAGFGGQGVLTSGLITATAAKNAGKEVLWMPAYGGQMRGGKSYSLVKFGDAPICHPDIEELDVLTAMNRPALDGYGKYVKEGGLVLINSDTVDAETPADFPGVRVVRAPLATLAREVKNEKGANIAALGLMIRLTDMFEPAFFLDSLLEYFEHKGKNAYASLNRAAFQAGYSYSV